MTDRKKDWDDKKIEIVIGQLLRYGVLIAAAVVLFGGVFYLLKSGGAHPDYSTFKGEAPYLKSLPQTVKEAFTFHRFAIIQFGLMILVAIPVFRVAFSLFAFLFKRDLTYVVVTLIVLGVLLFSIFAGGI
jgi:uncharacterized membrane protein